MNPVLVVLILIAGALLWLLASFLYRPIGRMFGRLISDAKEAILEEDTPPISQNNTNEGEKENE